MMADSNNTAGEGRGFGKNRLTLLGIIILVVGTGVAAWFVMTRPKAKMLERPKTTPIVEVEKLGSTSAQVHIQAMGTVIAADEAEIQAEVIGRIVWVHPEMVEGGFVKSDTVIIRIDDRDYRLDLDRQRAALKAAQADLVIERGQQDIAKVEWELVNENDPETYLDRELALRKPQLKAAKAAVDSARSAVKKAALDLERTEIRAPFNAVVTEAKADIGDRASPGIVLARLVSTETFWVKASVRADQLKWLKLPESDSKEGSDAVVLLPSGKERNGRLIKLIPELESSGRMAQVLIEVKDPLLLESGEESESGLLLNDFVRVEINGSQVDNVIRISRTALREGANVWLLDKDNRLRITKADILWSTPEEVFLENNFEPGSRLVVSSLGAPVEGMSLSAEGENSNAREPGEK